MLLVLLQVCLSLHQAAAQDAMNEKVAEAVDTFELLKEETVSIAVRHEQPISEAPSPVYVITDEDIRQSGAIDIPTILRRIPGMEVMQTTGADFNVSVRGDNQLQANKLLVMIDGRSIYLEGQGIVFWKLLPVTLPEIKRIEVLKGPASVVYGFNAFDGVINIITKSPKEAKGTTMQIAGGEFGTLTSSVIHANTYGNLGYKVSAGWDQNQEWDDRDALAFRAYKFNAQTEYALSDLSKVLVSGGLVDSNRFDGPIVSTVNTASRPKQGYVSVVYEGPKLLLRGWWTRFKNTGEINIVPILSNLQRTTDGNGDSSVNKEKNDNYNFDVQHFFEFPKTNRLTYGMNYRHIRVSSNFLPDPTHQNRLGLYLQDEWKPTQTLNIVAGLRFDMHSDINPTYSPRGALIYKPWRDHAFRVSISMAQRPPTPFELDQEGISTTTLPPPFPSPPPLVFRGSSNLGPEQIISYELAYQGWFLKHRLRIRTELFYNHISDLVGVADPTPTEVTFENQGKADIYGVEAGLEFLATPWLTGFVNYAYQELDQNFVGESRRAAPRSKVNAGLRGEWENGLSGDIAYHYYGAVTYPLPRPFTAFLPLGITQVNPRVGSYNLLNIRAGYRFWLEQAAAVNRREAEVAVSVFNALNDKHKEHPLGETIKSRVMGWLTVRF